MRNHREAFRQVRYVYRGHVVEVLLDAWDGVLSVQRELSATIAERLVLVPCKADSHGLGVLVGRRVVALSTIQNSPEAP